MATVTGLTKPRIEEGLVEASSVIRSVQFGTSPLKTAAENAAAIVSAVATANTYGIPVQVDQDLPCNAMTFTNQDVRIIGNGRLIQQLGQSLISIQREWGSSIPCFAPSLMKFGNDGVQGAANVSIITIDGGTYAQFENGDAYNISSNDLYSWNASSGGGDTFYQVKAGMLTVQGVGLTVTSVVNGGPIEGLLVRGAESNSTGIVQSVISQGGATVNVIFNKVSANFAPGENLVVQTGGSTAVTSGTLLGVAGGMYLVKAGLPFVDTYTNSVKLRKVDRSVTTKLDLRIKAENWDSYVAPSQRRDAVIVAGAYDIDVKIEAQGCWSRALALTSCYQGRFSAIVDGAPNHTGADQSAFGYGVSLMGSTENLDGYINVRNVRHGITTNVNYTADWSSDGKKTLTNGSIVDIYREWGTQKYCRITGVGVDCSNAPFDTHAGAMFFEFYDCVAKMHTGMGRTASTSRVLFTTRGIGTRYYNCHADGGGFQENGSGLNTGYRHQYYYHGCTVRNGGQYGFVQPFASYADGSGGFWAEILIENCNFHMDGTIAPYAAQRPILLSTTDAKVRGCSVSNFNDAPVGIVSTGSNGKYEFTNFVADYSSGVGRKPFQISGTVSLVVDYWINSAAGVTAIFESVTGGTNVGILDINRLGPENLPPFLLNTSGSGQVTWRGLRPLRRISSIGDASITVVLSASGSVLKFDTPLSATRVVTLPTDGSATNGEEIDVIRTAAATNVNGVRYVTVVANSVTLVSLDINQSAKFRYDGTNWFMSQPPAQPLGTIDTNAVAVGIETIARNAARDNVAMTSGVIRFAYFTARKSELTTRMRMCSGTTAAVATPTLVKYALFSVDPTTGDLTRIAITANDTSTFAAVSQTYTKNWLASASVILGMRYAVAALVVSSVTVPTVSGNIPVLPSFEVGGTDPVMAKVLTGQTDIGASYTNAALADTTNIIYAVVRA